MAALLVKISRKRIVAGGLTFAITVPAGGKRYRVGAIVVGSFRSI
jgi:hypothetical protein